MLIKKYIVNNMNEAMSKIRYELGKEAIIVTQRKIRKPGISGFFKKKVIEVTAAVDNKEKKNNNSQNSMDFFKKIMESKQALMNNTNDVNVDDKKDIYDNKKIDFKEKKIPKKVNSNHKDEKNILNQLEEMKSMISKIADKNENNPTEKSKGIENLLKENDLNEDIISEILKKIDHMDEDIDDLSKTKTILKEMLPECKINLEGPVVLVGPTGVGKTTTIAKLAGKLALIEKKKVGLITTDTYRIGAVEQLKTYADIMRIPFKVALSTKDMKNAIKEMNDCDTILIDTTGRSSRNTMQISELRSFVDSVQTDNIYLVMSATTKNKDINSIVEGYTTLGYNNIIITKLDETTTYGSVINIINATGRPVSFVTVGQNVPDDLKQINPEEMVELVLGESSVC